MRPEMLQNMRLDPSGRMWLVSYREQGEDMCSSLCSTAQVKEVQESEKGHAAPLDLNILEKS